MPMIRGRYYANPAYGEAMERARQAELESALSLADEDARHPSGRAGEVHHIHILRHPDGVRVHVYDPAPGSDAGDEAPSGPRTTHNFDRDDHRGISDFVSSVLARGQGKPTGRAPFAGS